MYRGGVKKCQTLTFKVNFLYQISSEYFWFFSHFLITSIFKSLYFLNDVQFLTAHHYSNSQNSIISLDYSQFLAKNLFNFVSLPWKLHNRYCHSVGTFKFCKWLKNQIEFVCNQIRFCYLHNLQICTLLNSMWNVKVCSLNCHQKRSYQNASLCTTTVQSGWLWPRLVITPRKDYNSVKSPTRLAPKEPLISLYSRTYAS